MPAAGFDAAALRRAREGAGMTRARLAELVGTDVEVVGLWEDKGVVPTPGRMKRAAAAVGLTVDDLWQPPPEAPPLAILRVRAGFGQRSLAQRIGVSQALVSRLERGRADLGDELAAALAEALGATVDEVTAAVDAARPQTPPEESPQSGEGEPPTLASLRVSAGLSQRELAEMIGANATAVSRAERGKSRVGSTQLSGYAKALGVSVMDVARAADRTHELYNVPPRTKPLWRPSDFWVGADSPHLVITQDDPRTMRARVTSPQHPRLDLPLRLNGISLAEATVINEHMGADALHRFNHTQLRVVREGPEEAVYLTRWQLDMHDGLKRYKPVLNINFHIHGIWKRHPERAPRHRLPAGEHLLVVVDARDPLWWISNQLATGETATLIPNYPEHGPSVVTAVGKDQSGELLVLGPERRFALADLGLDAESSHRDLTEAVQLKDLNFIPGAVEGAAIIDEAEQFDAYYSAQLAKPRP